MDLLSFRPIAVALVDGFARVEALYSPWQLLYFEDALQGGEVTLSIDDLDEPPTSGIWRAPAMTPTQLTR